MIIWKLYIISQDLFLNNIKRWYLETVAISLKEALILP